VGYGPFSLWVIHKESLCPSSGDINRLMMMMKYSRLLTSEVIWNYWVLIKFFSLLSYG
jgi:hypothetical protein